MPSSKIATTRGILTIAFSLAAIILPANAYANSIKDLPIYKPGQVFRDCFNCPELVVIPRGSFIMGLKANSKKSLPAHQIQIKEPFAMGRFEVKFSEWQQCVDDGGCNNSPDDHHWGKKDRPVINITYFETKKYMSWITKRTGFRYRLPSESEWAYANRAGTTTIWWWGNKVGRNHANCKDCKSPWSDGGDKSHGTAPVGMFPPNPFGLYDTTANVFEWVDDCWNNSYKGAPNNGTAWTQGDCYYRVIRGGSFYYFSKVGRSSYRAKNPPNVKSYWLGFRVLRELK